MENTDRYCLQCAKNCVCLVCLRFERERERERERNNFCGESVGWMGLHGIIFSLWWWESFLYVQIGKHLIEKIQKIFFGKSFQTLQCAMNNHNAVPKYRGGGGCAIGDLLKNPLVGCFYDARSKRRIYANIVNVVTSTLWLTS